ncbi:hypothetical protein Tco_1315240 [Tanacetum coccineum]
MEEFIAHSVLSAVQESVSAKVIQEVKKRAPSLVSDDVIRTEQITLTSSPTLSSTNITIPQLRETLYEMMTNDLDSIIGDINTNLYIALSKSVEQDKETVPKDSCKKANLKKRSHDDQDPPKNHEGEKRHKKSRFVGQSFLRNDQAMPDAGDHKTQPSTARKTREYPRWLDGWPIDYTDYTWVTRLDAEDRFNEVVNTYLDPDEPEDGEIVPDNSTLTFKAENEYNMDQMTIAMSDDMDWALDHGLGIKSKDLLPLIGPKKYAYSVTKHRATEYKCGWIKEDIGKLWRKTLVNYDTDAMLGIQKWEKMKRLTYKDELFEYGFLKSIIVTRANKKRHTFKESDFNQLNLNDIEDTCVLKAQGKLKHLGRDIEYCLV